MKPEVSVPSKVQAFIHFNFFVLLNSRLFFFLIVAARVFVFLSLCEFSVAPHPCLMWQGQA